MAMSDACAHTGDRPAPFAEFRLLLRRTGEHLLAQAGVAAMQRSFDHIVVAARDLDALADVWRRMGFHVGARNQHPWGTRNHIVQFAGSFIELISIDKPYHPPLDPDPAMFSMAAFIHDHLERREGAAMISLTSEDPQADLATFHTADLGRFAPFHFERRGKRADGSDTHVAFTLAFARARTMPDLGFFTCRQHYPENFWDVRLQHHANAASGPASVAIVADDPADHAEFLSHFTDVRDFRATSMGVSFRIGPGGSQGIDVYSPLAYAHRFGQQALGPWDGAPRIAAVEFVTSSMEATRAAFVAGHVPYVERHDALVAPPSAALGLALIVSPAPQA